MERTHLTLTKWAVAAVAAALLVPSAALADSTGLAAAYSFDEAAGASAFDASGNGNTGTLGGPARSASGRSGGALAFDGVNDLVTVPDVDGLDLVSGMTLEAWVNPSRSTGWQTVLLKERAAGLAYALYLSEGNRPQGVVFTSDERDSRASAQLPVNTWTHVATTYDGATLRVYANGSQVASRAVSGSIAASSGALRIGGNAVWDEFFAGRIDDVRVYRRTLTGAEISADMATPVSTPDVQAPSAPGGLTATVADVKRVDLAWTPATDDRGVAGYEVHRSGTAGFTPSAATLRTTVAAPGWSESLSAPGAYHYKVLAVDAAGNAGPAAGASAVLPADTTPPTVSINNPLDGAIVSRLVQIGVSASDDWGVDRRELQVDGGAWVELSAIWAEWDSTQLPDGSHTLVARASDAAGNVGVSAPVTVTTANTPTVARITSPVAGEVIGGGAAITFKADASAAAGVDRVQFTYGQGTGGGFLGSDSAAPYEVRFDDSSVLGHGEYWVQARVWEPSGYWTDSEKVYFTLDNRVGTPVGLTAAVSDNDVSLAWGAPTGGNLAVARYDVHRGTTPDFAVTSANRIASVTTPAYADPDRPAGTHHYKVIAVSTYGIRSTPATASAVIAPKDLIAAYGFEEPSGTTAGDASGSGHTGTIAGATRTTAGRFGRALTFDGVNDLVDVAHTSAFNSPAVTLEAWVRPTVVSWWRTALMKQRGSDMHYALYAVTGSGRPSWNVRPTGEFGTIGTATMQVNTWTHLATTYDGSVMRLYVNGTQVSSRSVGESMPASDGPLTIGGNHVWDEWFQGQIDEVRVYNRALSASEILADRDRAVG